MDGEIALHVAEVTPPFTPLHVHVHGPEPVTLEASPMAQRFVVGILARVAPFEVPQYPFCALIAVQLAGFPPLVELHDHEILAPCAGKLGLTPPERVEFAAVQKSPAVDPSHAPLAAAKVIAFCPHVAFTMVGVPPLVDVAPALPPSLVFTKLPPALANAPVLEEADIKAWIFELEARAVPEYAATTPLANAARSVSFAGNDPDEKTSLGINVSPPELLCRCIINPAGVPSEIEMIPDAVIMFGTAMILTLLPVETFTATPLNVPFIYVSTGFPLSANAISAHGEDWNESVSPS